MSPIPQHVARALLAGEGWVGRVPDGFLFLLASNEICSFPKFRCVSQKPWEGNPPKGVAPGAPATGRPRVRIDARRPDQGFGARGIIESIAGR